MPDLYTLDRPAAYYDNLLANSPATARYLMKTYALHPPDDADGDKGRLVRDIDIRKAAAIKVADMFNKKVAWLHFSRSARGQYWKTGNEGGDTLYGAASYRAGLGVPVYWLPWDSGGAVVTLKIPRQGTRGRDAPDPDRFFTAAINGCSVFFTGDPDSPNVHHCGGATEQSGAAAGAKFWRDLITRMHGSGVQGVDKQDYITTEGVKNTQGLTTTQAAKDYEAWLAKETSGHIEIEDVRPWGCVMGIREDGLWKFYLQENASISYYTLKKKGIFSSKLVREKEKALSLSGGVVSPVKDKKGRDVVVDRKRTVSRPIRFYEVYPNRKQPVRIDQPVPKAKHG